MGIPYSRQINAAFEQVTPLVAEGFEVLQTTRNITFLLAEIQILTVVLLFFILVAILMLLVTMNPEMEQERKALVTPVLRWVCSWMMSRSGKLRYGLIVVLTAALIGAAVYAHYWYYFKDKEPAESDQAQEVEQAEGKDVDAIKAGRSKQ